MIQFALTIIAVCAHTLVRVCLFILGQKRHILSGGMKATIGDTDTVPPSEAKTEELVVINPIHKYLEDS